MKPTPVFLALAAVAALAACGGGQVTSLVPNDPRTPQRRPTPTPIPSPTPSGTTVFNVLTKLPQFGIYNGGVEPPGYVPPPGVQVWFNNGVWYQAIKLTAAQQAQIGSYTAARITYTANCDNYDRIAGVFYAVKPTGVALTPSDPHTEIVHFISPFSDYTQGALATHVYPDANVSQYAHALADTSHDVWIGFSGGGNPYSGDPCATAGITNDVAFYYSLDLVVAPPAPSGAYSVFSPVAYVAETSLPVNGTFSPTAATNGNVTVLVDSHGPVDEYEYTQDTVLVNGVQVGAFSTQINCAQYAQYSPDGNPGIFQNNLTNNPRNWCPGALVPSHTFPASLNAGNNTVSLVVSPSTITSGDYFQTSINFTSP